jgi:HEAT repeat protein
MKTFAALLVFATLATSAFAQQPPPREEWYRGLELEEAAGSAELILVAHVEEVSQIRLVRGGKGESSMQQFRLKPVRVVKGVFARLELILGSSDLAGYRLGGELKRIKAGQVRLLFLGRSDVGYRNVNEQANSLDHALPPLADENDPLIQSVAALLAVRAEPDRYKRVALLVEALEKHSGPAAVPLLSSLASRALLGAQHAGSTPAITRHLADPSPAVRIAAASALRSLLAADYLERVDREQAAAALAAALGAEGRNLVTRAALIGAVGELGAVRDPLLIAQLDFEQPTRSLAVRTEQIAAVGKLQLAAFKDRLLRWSQSLPLDAPHHEPTEIALARVDATAGSVEMARRAEEKVAAGFGCESEISAAGALPDADAAALLLRLAALPLNATERRFFAGTARMVCDRTPDERLVAPLAKLLDPDEPETRDGAVEALLRIGSQTAAQALQPRIAQEQYLLRKLRIAELLGKHGMRDGYAYAIEHVSEPWLTEQAVAALVAMRDPRTVEEARKIFETSNDVTWNRAAIRILGALGTREFAPKFSALLADWKNPLAPAALIALADLGERETLPKINEALAARSDSIVIAGAAAARRMLALPQVDAADTRNRLAALLADFSASEQTRRAALDTLVAIQDPRLDRALPIAAGDANLERTDLLAVIERLLRERKIKLP